MYGPREIIISIIAMIQGYSFISYLGIIDVFTASLASTRQNAQSKAVDTLNKILTIAFALMMYFGFSVVWIMFFGVNNDVSISSLGKIFIRFWFGGLVLFGLLNARSLSRKYK